MPILKKAVKKPADKIPMFHKGDTVSFDVDDQTFTGEITKIDLDAETAVVVSDGDDYECEFKELKPAEEKPKKKAKAEPVDDEEPKKKSSKGGSSLASAFKNAKVASKAAGLPVGKYEALVVDMGTKETEKGTSGFVKYTVVNDKDVEGKSGVAFYQLQDADGGALQGLEFFKRDIFSIGVDEDKLDACESKDEIDELLFKVAKKNVWVNISVVEKNGYINIFLQGVEEDQDNKPDMP